MINLELGIIPNEVDKSIENVSAKSIFSPKLARHLLKRGHKIVDIKPDKRVDSKFKTIFIFEKTDSLIRDLQILKRGEEVGEK